jgi:hypothetical protein
MTIKSFFRDLGRKIKRGFNTFVSGAGDLMGKGGTFLQQKAIPAIASGANKVAGLIDKASPLLDVAGPEATATAGEVADVAKQVGAGVGKFADFIGSNAKQGRVATPDEINKFRSQIPQGKTFFGIKPLPPPMPMPTAPKLAVMPMPKGLISPAPPNPLRVAGAIKAPIGSNPASYSPMRPSGIEAPPADQSLIKAVGSAPAGMLSM